MKNNHILQKISLNNLPNDFIKNLETIPYYRIHKSEINTQFYNINTLIDSKTFLEHSNDFIRPNVNLVITFLSGGTVQRSKHIPYTLLDYHNSIQATVSALKMSNVVKGLRICLMHPFAPWAIGIIFMEALIRLGCYVIPLGFGMDPQRCSKEILDFKPEVVIGPASLLFKIIKKAKYFNYCRAVINAGEPYDLFVRQQFEELGLETFDIYGMAEFDTIAAECCKHKMHLLEDYFFFECLTKNELNKPLAGELIITPLRREAFSIFRYRTYDFVEVDFSPCLCGRIGPTLRKIERVQSLYIDGVSITTFDLEQAIESTGLQIKEYQLCAIKGLNGQVEIRLDFVSDEIIENELLQKLYYALEHINLDWEDLIRCQSCYISSPQQVNSLANRKTRRGKLSKIVWIENKKNVEA